MTLAEKNSYFLVSFITGGALLTVEFANVKLVEPYFGHSFPVWASTIGTTMIGLALGYYFSQNIIDRFNKLRKVLFILLSILSLLIGASPFISPTVFSYLVSIPLQIGIITATILINVPVFYIFGHFSPLIIELISKDVSLSGQTAGKVYGISTIGGVFFIVIAGVWFLPNLGVIFTLVSLSVLLFLSATLVFYFYKKNEE